MLKKATQIQINSEATSIFHVVGKNSLAIW